MKRRLSLFAIGLSFMFILTSCRTSSDGQSDSPTDVPAERAPPANVSSEPDNAYETPAAGFSAKGAVKIEEIDWSVEESLVDGECFISFGYTNNSPYTILDLEIRFEQRENLTAEDLAAFDELKAEREWSDEDVARIHIEGANHKCAFPGDTVSGYPCNINGTGTWVQSMAQYELMEPDMATICLIGDDGKGYVEYYDFKSNIYGESSQGGIDLHQWSDSELAQLLPKAESVAVQVDRDDEEVFYFTAYGSSVESFTAYVEEVKKKGFTVVDYEGPDTYRATDGNGIQAVITFDSMRNELEGYVKIQDKK